MRSLVWLKRRGFRPWLLGGRGLDRFDLLLRHQFALRFGQIHSLSPCIGGLLIVAGNHNQALNAELA